MRKKYLFSSDENLCIIKGFIKKLVKILIEDKMSVLIRISEFPGDMHNLRPNFLKNSLQNVKYLLA